MSRTEEHILYIKLLPVRRNVDAVIVISFDIASNEIEQLRSIDVPIIGINSSLPEERGFNAAVRIDDKQGSELAARHLMMLGHRDIVYIRSDREVTLHFSVQGRYAAFMACSPANGVEPRVLVAAAVPAGTQRFHRAERHLHHRLRRQHLRARPRPDHHPSDPCRDGPRSGPHDTRANREAAARRTVQDVPRAADRPFDHRSSA